MDAELDIHDLLIKMRQFKALIEADSVVSSFELRDRLQNLEKVDIRLQDQNKKEMSEVDKVEKSNSNISLNQTHQNQDDVIIELPNTITAQLHNNTQTSYNNQ